MWHCVWLEVCAARVCARGPDGVCGDNCEILRRAGLLWCKCDGQYGWVWCWTTENTFIIHVKSFALVDWLIPKTVGYCVDYFVSFIKSLFSLYNIEWRCTHDWILKTSRKQFQNTTMKMQHKTQLYIYSPKTIIKCGHLLFLKQFNDDTM